MLRVESKCPECNGPVEQAWIVCAECGASLRPTGRRVPAKVREAALPSGDVGVTAFVPYVGGAKRPVTILQPRVAPAVRRSSASPLLGARHDDTLPVAPPTEDSRHRITVMRTDPVQGGPAIVTELEEEAIDIEIDKALEEPEPLEDAPLGEAKVEVATEAVQEAAHEREVDAPELFEAFPTEEMPGPELVNIETESELAHTKLEPAPEVQAPAASAIAKRPLSLRVAREDLAEIQSIVDQVVKQRLREVVAAQAAIAARATAVASEAAREIPRLRRLAAGGAGLLVGAAAADLLVLNWDLWVRGEVLSSVGWLQQLGLIGAAALAGAGASAAYLGSSLVRRRKKLRAAQAQAAS